MTRSSTRHEPNERRERPKKSVVSENSSGAPLRRSNRREAIRDVAAQIFADRGYDRAALQEVADAMGFTKANIYYYYRSKDELLFDILTFAHTEIEAILEREIASSSSPLDKVRRIVTAHVTWYLQHPSVARITFRDWSALVDKSLQVQIARRKQLGHLLRQSIEECCQTGEARPNANVRLMANFINGAVAATNVWFNPEGPEQPEMVGRAFGDMAVAIVRIGQVPDTRRSGSDLGLGLVPEDNLARSRPVD